MSDLSRFVAAQDPVYTAVLAELRSGRKRSHWMWFVFPQIRGLGASAMSQRYAVHDRSEAEAYLAHPVLGPRLKECVSAVLLHCDRTAYEIFGAPDDAKFRSCLSLFNAVAPDERLFRAALIAFYDGEPDLATLRLLGM